MKLAILSGLPKCYSTRRLREAAVERGHKVKVLDTKCFAIDIEHNSPDLIYKGKRISHYDAIIPRISPAITYFGTAVVRQFEQMDVYTPSPANGIINSRDKLRSLQILGKHDIGIPNTTFVRNREDVLPAFERVGGAPVIIKLIEGTQGVGVILAEDVKMAEAIVETLQTAKQNVLIQKFVKESRGTDIRAFVVGDRVVAAMRRRAQGQEFRSNLHRGSRAETVQLEESFERAAVKSANVLGLKIAGVDMLEGADGPQVMEVNSSPGLEGIEATTQLDIAGEVIEYIQDQIDFPQLDIRQRLTVSKGFGVSEIMIPKESEFIGKTIAESGLEERELNVLTLRRGQSTISNPRMARVLEPGDRLLCYGKLNNMRDLIPSRKKRRKARKVGKLESQVASELLNAESESSK